MSMPLFRFACPACQKILKTSPTNAGRKSHCPRCGQRLQVPAPPAQRKRTMLGRLLPDRPVTAQASAASTITEIDPGHNVAVALPPAAVHDTEVIQVSEDAGRSRILPPLLITVSCASMVAVAGWWLLSDRPQRSGTRAAPATPAAVKAEAWTELEMMRYLHDHEIPFHFVAHESDRTTWVLYQSDSYFERNIQVGHEMLRTYGPRSAPWNDGVVIMQVCPSAAEAKRLLALMEQNGLKGDNEFAWNRFLFVGSRPFIAQIRGALVQP